jgi:3-phytase
MKSAIFSALNLWSEKVQRVQLLIIIVLTLTLIAACDFTGPPSHWKSIRAVAETQPVHRAGDAADDPAIWYNRSDPSTSLVVATDKRSGLFVYDLNGKELSFTAAGEPNNVDLRELTLADGQRRILVAVSDRLSNAVKFFMLDENSGSLTPLQSDLQSELGEIYGLCMYQPGPDVVEVFALGRSGKIERYQSWIRESGGVHMGRLQGISVPSMAEGCAADDQSASLYIAEENAGIWHFDLSLERPEGELKASIADGQLVADVEGLAIGDFKDIKYLVASSQGNHSFVIYEVDAERLILLGTFHVTAGKNTDGLYETDGIELVSLPFDDKYPHGLLVLHDGDNAPANQNFKYVSWQDVMQAFGL